ncbi:unnamed protein product [Effrenium voratum]|nr:unnamed protein product [Effrenium voratum]
MALRFNFRCKAGIATLARSVSQLLLERFPQAADHINEETTLKGERPLFVRLADRRALDLYIAGRGCRRLHAVDPTCIAILVRSDAARKSLRSRWRKQAIDGLILTPAEAKGLEFDMVILIDFFAESRKAVWDLADDSSDSSQLAAAIAKGTGECAEKRDLWDLALAIPEPRQILS